MSRTCMCITCKLVPMRYYVYLLANRTHMYIGTTTDYGNCIMLDFLVLHCFSMSTLVCMHMYDFKCRIMTGNTSKQGRLKRKGKIIEEQEHQGRC